MVGFRSDARFIRFAIFAIAVIGCGFIISGGYSYASINTDATSSDSGTAVFTDQAQNKAADPSRQVFRPNSEGRRTKATFFSLVRNEELDEILLSIQQIQDRFNSRYNYDWVFLTEKPFTDEFKRQTSALVTGKAKYGFIEKDQWSFPSWIDLEKAAETVKEMHSQKIHYGGSISYRHMSRYVLGFFFRHPLMMDYDYYWRVEPGIRIFCDVDYDIFKWMKDNRKDYSFILSVPEYLETIPTLWHTTKNFIAQNSQYLAQNNLMRLISPDDGATYNGCQFLSHFEIGNLNFFRLEAYIKYFEHLDAAGGFYYERWGDAPIHSMAVSLFLPMEKVHFFNDIGYEHIPFANCPIDPEIRVAKKCICNPYLDVTWKKISCVPRFHDITKLPRMRGWEFFSN